MEGLAITVLSESLKQLFSIFLGTEHHCLYGWLARWSLFTGKTLVDVLRYLGERIAAVWI